MKMAITLVTTMFISLGASGLLTSCATTGGGGTLPDIGTIQQDIVAACGFLPTVATIANLISGGMFGSELSLINAVCSAVTGKAARSGRVGASIGGVVIHGRFVR